MTPNFGDNGPGDDTVPDWFLGGDRRRRVLEALADPAHPEPWTAEELTETVGCGPATTYEVLRALGPLDVLEVQPRGQHRLKEAGPLATELRAFIKALGPYRNHAVNRPPRGDRRA
jgi:hypothetical protein